MTADEPPADEAAPAPPRGGWTWGDIPGWVLVVGLVVFAVAGLGLATLGGVGIVLVAVLELGVMTVLYRWCSVGVPG